MNQKPGVHLAGPINTQTVKKLRFVGKENLTTFPVATMYRLDAGVTETHFGNNVSLAVVDYTIVVTVGDEAATFQVTIPAS